MAKTRGNKNNVILVLFFIALVAFSTTAEVSNNKKFIKFPPSMELGTEKTRTPANPYHRGCSPLTRCRGSRDR